MDSSRASEFSPLIDIIVLSYNGRRWLRRCLESAVQQTYAPCRITVWDNASTDGSVEFIRGNFLSVDTWQSSQNLGFARAYNLAVRRSPAPLVALLNQDAYVEPDWLEHLARVLLSDPHIAAVTSRIRFAEEPSRLQHAGSTLTYAGIGWDRSFGQADCSVLTSPQEVGGFSGAAALVRRSAFLGVGGFDDRFFAFCEDTDLSWRFWLAGYRVLFAPQAVAYHYYGGSGGTRRSDFRLYHAQKNRIASFSKNLSGSRLPLAVILSVAFDVYRSIQYLSDGQPKLVWALLRGTVAALREFSTSLEKRRMIQRQRVRRDSVLEHLGVLASPVTAVREYLRLEALPQSDGILSGVPWARSPLLKLIYGRIRLGHRAHTGI